MIRNSRFLFSTLMMVFFVAVCYVFGISWSAITYHDWLGSEVSGIYFDHINWQTIFSTFFLFYWSINISIPIQTIVRLRKSNLLARVYARKTLVLAGIFAFIYWAIPWMRIFQFNPSNKELASFFVLWIFQVIVAMCWTLIPISLVQIAMNYMFYSPIIMGLILTLLTTMIAYLPFFNGSIFSQIQITAFIRSGALNAGTGYALFALCLYAIILLALYILFQNSIRRREWIK
ncbi:hypothetical protein [Oenococcus sicerae]|uniref:Uncharacterized protein n=1 Tax=Oenococcus sicerae TaxID=2203724 RepID=A0AAJ1VNU1_9LACO|nr:hypothetical protein [Oenococcus sicerae]MDN6900174.1 hypothetical protein [Oenococcus sicerae]